MASITDQNWIVWNQGKNPLVNFNFMLRVELLFDLPCKSVRAFTRELEYDYIQEGGLNDYVHMRRKPISRPFTLEIERYVGVDYIDPLPLGADLVLPVLLFVSRNHDQFIPGVVARTYVFTGCTVMKKTYGDLVADQSGLLVETTTLGYREMLCVDIPWSEVGDNMFKDVKSVPTNAVSEDKTPAELKALANDLYSQALAAKTRADVEFAEGNAADLISRLEETLKKLRAAVGPGGALTQQLDAAKRGVNGEGGKAKRKIADEAMDDARLLNQEAKAAEDAWRKKDAAWRKANDALGKLQRQTQEPADQLKALEAQLEKNKADKAAIEERLPAGIRDEEAAKASLAEAQKAYDEAEKELDEAKNAVQSGIDDNPNLKAAQEMADDAAAGLASKEAEVETAEQALAEARAAHEKALRPWVEKQNEELDRAAEKRRSCERQVSTRSRDIQRFEEGTEERKQAEDALKQARDALTAAAGEEEAQKEKIAKGPVDEQEIESLRQAAETAEADLEKARTERDSAAEEDADAQKELQEARKEAEKSASAGEAGKRLERASEARNTAKKTLDGAERCVKDCAELAALNAALETLEAEMKDAEAALQAAGGGQQQEAEQQEAETRAEAEQAKKDFDTASEKWHTAEDKAETAREAAEQAERALNKAQTAHNMGSKQINSLQNSLTNMKTRKDTGKKGQEDCTDQHDKCKEANTALQALPNDNLPEVNAGYEKVKKLSKQTCYHEKQVREVCQHMEAAEKLLSEVVEIPDAEA